MAYKIDNISGVLNVYISGVMDDDTCNKIAVDITNASEAGATELLMHINSYGGSVAGAYALISAIRNTNMRFVTQNEGFAISAAGILLAAGDESKAFDYSTALIHDPLIGGRTLKETDGADRNFLTKIKDGLMTVLNKRLKLDISELTKMMSKETSLNAIEQLALGLVDSIIETGSKPKILENLSMIEVWNIIDEHNNYFDTKENMIENKIDEVADKAIELENRMKDLVTENKSLKVENFILVNKLDAKKDLISNAVEKYGVDVLTTILEFVDNKVVIETKEEVKELEAKLETVENKLEEIVNKTNDDLDAIVSNTGSVDYSEMAEEYFGIKADNNKRLELKNENPSLHDKLFNIYYEL